MEHKMQISIPPVLYKFIEVFHNDANNSEGESIDSEGKSIDSTIQYILWSFFKDIYCLNDKTLDIIRHL